MKDRFKTAEFSIFFATGMIALSVGLLLFLRNQQPRHAGTGAESAGAASASRNA